MKNMTYTLLISLFFISLIACDRPKHQAPVAEPDELALEASEDDDQEPAAAFDAEDQMVEEAPQDTTVAAEPEPETENMGTGEPDDDDTTAEAADEDPASAAEGNTTDDADDEDDE